MMRDSEQLDIPQMAPRPAAAAGAYRSYRQNSDEGGMRRLLMVAGGIVIALVVLVGVWSLLGHSHTGPAPVVEADSKPWKTKPENAGGMQLDAAEQEEAADAKGDALSEKLAPPPEVPAPQALKAQIAEAARAAAAPPPLAVPMPDDAVATPPRAAAKPAGGKPTQLATAKAAPPPPASAAPAVPAPPAAAAAAHHAAVVQLAALPTEQLAHQEWDRLAHKLPELFAGHKPSFSKTDRDGHEFWRLRTDGFADATQAKSFCEQIRAKGGACAIAAF